MQYEPRLQSIITHPLSQKIFALIPAGSGEIRCVGGAVRNALAGWELQAHEPFDVRGAGPPLSRHTPDLDFATSLDINRFSQSASAAGLGVYPTGIHHGTVTVSDGQYHAEITQLRSDLVTDGRHAEVGFHTDWAQDAARRDFTINAIYLDQTGQIFDPLDGISDLAQNKLCFIGSPLARLEEDYLRLLRAIRLCAEYPSLKLEERALPAMKQASGQLASLSSERILSEIKRLFRGRGFFNILDYLPVLQIDKLVLGTTLAPWLFERQEFSASFWHAIQKADFPAQLCLFSSEPEKLLSHASSLRLSRIEKKALTAYCALAIGQHKYASQGEKLGTEEWMQARYWLGEKTVFSYLYAVATGCCAFDEERMRQIVQTKMPVCPVTGEDVITILKVEGAIVGSLLEALKKQWVESGFTLTRKQILTMLKHGGTTSL